MSISLNNFVTISINRRTASAAARSRDTAVILYDANSDIGSSSSFTGGTFASIAEVNASGLPATSKLYKYLKTFFANNGVKIKAIGLTSMDPTEIDFAALLAQDEVLVTATSAFTDFGTCATNYLTEIEEDNASLKMFFIPIKEASPASAASATIVNDNVVYVYGEYNAVIPAAYLTRVNVAANDTLHDFCYTLCAVENTSIVDNNTDYTTLMDANINFPVVLANRQRMIGGNASSAVDFVNQFALICLYQDLTDELINALTTKLKGFAGCAAIQNTCVQVLNKYVRNGYIVTNKVWDAEDWTEKATIGSVTYDFTIVEAFEPLDAGYKVLVLPYETLTAAQIQTHSAPSVYIAFAESYGIRKIEIKGEII